MNKRKYMRNIGFSFIMCQILMIKFFKVGTEIPEFPVPIPSINPFPIPITDSDSTGYSRNRFFGKLPVPSYPNLKACEFVGCQNKKKWKKVPTRHTQWRLSPRSWMDTSLPFSSLSFRYPLPHQGIGMIKPKLAGTRYSSKNRNFYNNVNANSRISYYWCPDNRCRSRRLFRGIGYKL